MRTRVVATQADLGAVVTRAARASALAVDVEADGLYAYRPRACTVQVAWRAAPEAGVDVEVVVIDALAVRLGDLGPLFGAAGPVKLLHDLTFDARLLESAGITLANVRDTSVAARLLGYKATGLASLLESELGVRVDKRFQQHDWSRRPLSGEQVEYLARDVAHLFALDEVLERRAAELDIVAEIADECAYKLASALATPRDVRPAWVRVKGASKLDPRGRAVLRRLVDVRERAAERANVPPFKIASSDVLLELARVQPRTAEELAKVRGAIAGRAARLAEAWLEAIASGVADGDVPPEERVWLETVRVDPGVLARRRAVTEALTAWRRAEAKARGVDEQAVLPGHCAQELVERVVGKGEVATGPPSRAEIAERIAAVSGIGARRLGRYANTLTDVVLAALGHATGGES